MDYYWYYQSFKEGKFLDCDWSEGYNLEFLKSDKFIGLKKKTRIMLNKYFPPPVVQ